MTADQIREQTEKLSKYFNFGDSVFIDDRGKPRYDGRMLTRLDDAVLKSLIINSQEID
jgi:hypothetical protein